MNEWVKVGVMLIILGIAGKYGYDKFQETVVQDEARVRITSVLERGGSDATEEEQHAITAWATGGGFLGADEMRALLPDWERFKQEAQLKGMGTFTCETPVAFITPEDRYAEVTCKLDGKARKFVHRANKPLEIVPN